MNSIKAFCYKRIAAKTKATREMYRLLDEAVKMYWQAGQKYPDDDEFCCCTLRLAVPSP